MVITTEPNLERNGADAIHIGKSGNDFVLYLGEAKTYHRKEYSFSKALSESVRDIIKHYSKHRSELSLYTYDDFVQPALQPVARDYLEGALTNVTVELVCMVTYNCEKVCGPDKDTILKQMVAAITEECQRFKGDVFLDIDPHVLPRLNYILFPVQDLDSLVTEFEKELGIS